jgi:hypothetical protein
MAMPARTQAATAVLLALGFLSALASLGGVTSPAHAQDACAPVERHFSGLIDRYMTDGRAAIDRDGPETALDRARQRAFRGDKPATVTIVGIGLAMRARPDSFHLASLRQICGFAERNNHPLHVAACAYFNALNPLGEQAEKRLIVEREITRFSELTDPLAREPGLADAMKALEACIAVTPTRQ